MRRTFVLVLLLSLTTSVFSKIRKVEVEEHPGIPVSVYGNERIPTMLKFPEKVFRVFLGSPSGWIVKVIGKEVVVRPRKKMSTGLIVELQSGRTVPIRLIVAERREADDIVYINFLQDLIQMDFAPRVEKKEQVNSHPEKKHPQEENWAGIGEYNFSYRWKNSKRIKIKAVFDDGVSTYIVYHRYSAIGAIYLKNPTFRGHGREMVNFVVRENVCRIDRRLNHGERFVVAYGKEKVEIKRI